jgi:hypothetical protein
MAIKKKLDTTDMCDSGEITDLIEAELEDNGIVVSQLTDGVFMAFTADKLMELYELAIKNEDRRMVIFVSNEDDDGIEPTSFDGGEELLN